MNLDQARYNMIEQQIRPWDVLDQRILDLMNNLPREAFVPAAYRSLAYADIAIPLDHEQSMMPPKIEARLLQALAIKPGDNILEIGTGSGYLTALLAKLGRHVHTLDLYPDFIDRARALLATHGLANISFEVADVFKGWNAKELYDVIAVTGSLPSLPPAWLDWLKPGGRLFAVIGTPPVMEAQLITRSTNQGYSKEGLFETDLPSLLHAPQASKFEF